jgi:hypothetical protein
MHPADPSAETLRRDVLSLRDLVMAARDHRLGFAEFDLRPAMPRKIWLADKR